MTTHENGDADAPPPKSAEELIREHEDQLNELVAEVEAEMGGVGGGDGDGINLQLAGLDLDRRDFMKAGMAVGAASAMAGCSAIDFGGPGEAGQVSGREHSVPPGELDEYYGFWSGGHSGEVRIVGIPMFQRESARGYGHDDETTQLLEEGGGYGWGDCHHPILSETDGDYDGRWLWINEKGNGRMARVDLKYFETDAITDIPNVQACHGCAVQSPDTSYVYGVGEFRTPVPNDGRNLDDPGEYWSLFSALDPASMEVQWQVRVSGNMDNADSGKDGRWAFATGYNNEEAFEIEGMTRDDRDYVRAFDVEAIEAALDAGEAEDVNGVPVLDGRLDSDLARGDDPIVYYIPTPKSPHGIDVEPTGTYAIASGKLSPTCTVIEIARIEEVDDPADAIVGQPQVGLGPLHTTFDDRGNAYTTVFIDSQVTKWNIQAAVDSPMGSEEAVLGKVDVHYNPGHLQAAEAETTSPAGDWLVSLNKLSKDRFLPVGPIHPDNDQLIYIGEDAENETGGMELVADEPVYPEPHDCVIAHRDKISPAVVWEREDYEDEKEYVTEDTARVERPEDGRVHFYATSKRSEYLPREYRATEGDEVTFTVTNIESSRDIVHGFAFPKYGINLAVAPQDTREVTFTADQAGVYWIYCTYFCSALHLEMRSRFVVEPG